jgi:toxoflavin synthase
MWKLASYFCQPALAKQEEEKEPLGIEYIIADVAEISFIDSFDLVVASFVLNYALTKEQLLMQVSDHIC